MDPLDSDIEMSGGEDDSHSPSTCSPSSKQEEKLYSANKHMPAHKTEPMSALSLAKSESVFGGSPSAQDSGISHEETARRLTPNSDSQGKQIPGCYLNS